MKKTISFSILFALFALLLPFSVYAADSTEQVRVIRFDKEKNDMIIERESGERMLIQHNRSCMSMSTEFPVSLAWSNNKITELKVAVNESCKVYNFGPYTGDVKITERTKSPNPLVTDHLAKVQWSGSNYEIDYGTGCTYLRDFVGQNAYVWTTDSKLDSSTLYLPSNRGKCTIKSAKLLGVVETTETAVASPITNLQFKAENNEVYFYWDKDLTDKKWTYLISNSKYAINPDDYPYAQMPNLKYTVSNEYTAKNLANGTEYFFYLSARDEKGNVAGWTEVKATPLLTNRSFKNNPDPEPFEVTLKENPANFVLTWPDKSANTNRYLLQFFVAGKRVLFKNIKGDLHEYVIEKKDEYNGKGLRFMVKSTPKSRFGVKYSDGIFWTWKKK